MKKRVLNTLFTIATIAGLAAVVAPIAASCSAQPTQQDNNQNQKPGDSEGTTPPNSNDNTDATPSQTTLNKKQVDALNAKQPEERTRIVRSYIATLKNGAEKSVWNELIRNVKFIDEVFLLINASLASNQITNTEMNNLKKHFRDIQDFFAKNPDKFAKEMSTWSSTAFEFNDTYTTTAPVKQSNTDNNTLGNFSWRIHIPINTIPSINTTFTFWLYLTNNVELKFLYDEALGHTAVKVSFNPDATLNKSKIRIKANSTGITQEKAKDLYFKHTVNGQYLPNSLLWDKAIGTNLDKFILDTEFKSEQGTNK